METVTTGKRFEELSDEHLDRAIAVHAGQCKEASRLANQYQAAADRERSLVRLACEEKARRQKAVQP